MTYPIDNRKVPHTVTLTEGQISTILFHLEGAVAKNASNLDEVHGIFEVLEGAIDKWYDDHHGITGKKLQSTQIASPIPPHPYKKDDDNYAEKVDALVESMKSAPVLNPPPVRRNNPAMYG